MIFIGVGTGGEEGVSATPNIESGGGGCSMYTLFQLGNELYSLIIIPLVLIYSKI